MKRVIQSITNPGTGDDVGEGFMFVHVVEPAGHNGFAVNVPVAVGVGGKHPVADVHWKDGRAVKVLVAVAEGIVPCAPTAARDPRSSETKARTRISDSLVRQKFRQ